MAPAGGTGLGGAALAAGGGIPGGRGGVRASGLRTPAPGAEDLVRTVG